MAYLFPMYINLENRNCLIVGGGKVAERKAHNLLDCGARVSVVSPCAQTAIVEMAAKGLLELQAREFCEADLNHVFIVFIATGNFLLNQEIAKACRNRNILVNAVDDPRNCDFYVPSVIKRNSLSIAISTEGKSPLFARKLREQLEDIITPAYGEFVDLLGEQREYLKENEPDIEKRRDILKTLVYSDILDLLKSGKREKAREKVIQCMSSCRD